jgi:hypothetical protein
MSEENLVKEILIRGLDDWLYLAEVKATVSSYFPGAPGDVIMATTLRLIEEVCRENLFEVGDVLRDRGFVLWQLEVDDAIGLIRERWKALERPLWPGDVCWLSLTEKGKQEARRIIENGEAPPGILTKE